MTLEWLKRSSAYQWVRPLRERLIARGIERTWRRNGAVAPPPGELKQLIVKELGRRYALRTLVETGTYKGAMISAGLRDFDRIISIELQPDLAAAAQARFAAIPTVTILQGDSGELIARVLADLREPALFWLDAHYSGGQTAAGNLIPPIIPELEAIFRHPVAGHVILIDDARLFDGTGGYPTVEQVRALDRRWSVTVDLDIIRLRRSEDARP